VENAAMVLLGAALSALVALAIAQHWLGIGEETDPPDVRIDLAASRLNAPGYDDPSAEYVCLVNSESEAVDLTAWQLREGNGDLVNTLPKFALAAGAGVRVHPGPGEDSPRDLFGDSGGPVWSNGGDSVTLVDADQAVVAEESYGEVEESPVRPCR
jgi:competence protein ComEC